MGLAAVLMAAVVVELLELLELILGAAAVVLALVELMVVPVVPAWLSFVAAEQQLLPQVRLHLLELVRITYIHSLATDQ